ncbi:hypothetical protein tpqmel_0413 [Candidatus Gastranaerophilus sp. (ex Termes propinquus)]|nr:hypothetical protein tpqmel_0413 [Candidatus Gastranaerophilus sp. (ex Termes propinquus)]
MRINHAVNFGCTPFRGASEPAPAAKPISKVEDGESCEAYKEMCERVRPYVKLGIPQEPYLELDINKRSQIKLDALVASSTQDAKREILHSSLGVLERETLEALVQTCIVDEYNKLDAFMTRNDLTPERLYNRAGVFVRHNEYPADVEKSTEGAMALLNTLYNADTEDVERLRPTVRDYVYRICEKANLVDTEGGYPLGLYL